MRSDPTASTGELLRSETHLGQNGSAELASREGREAGGTPALASVRRHWFFALFCVVVLTAGGVAVAVRRPQTYTASTELNVGKLGDIISQATPGYVQAAQVLAQSYSRLVDTDAIARPAAATAGITLDSALKRLSAAPVADSPTFYITASGPTSVSAVVLANAATKALAQYISTTNAQLGQGNSSTLLTKYQAAERTVAVLQARSNRLQALERSHPRSGTQSKILAVQVALQVATLRANTLAGEYSTFLQNGIGATVDVLQTATSASSDRRSMIERYGLIGLGAGLILAVALSTLIANLGGRRRRLAV